MTLCMMSDDDFAAVLKKATRSNARSPNGPKIGGDSWAARKEAAMWAEIKQKQAEARRGG